MPLPFERSLGLACLAAPLNQELREILILDRRQLR